MSIDELLQRDGLQPSIRRMALATIAIWRGDWERLARCSRLAAAAAQPRSDFEETLLQAVLFTGFPRVVTAFETLVEAWPCITAPTGGSLPEGEQAVAGRALFAAVYGRNTDAVHALLRSFHADFHSFVLESAYGRVLARPGLAPRVRELLAVSVLAAQDQVRQFVGHARGALHFGATRGELHEILVTAFGATPQVELWLRRV